MPQSFTGNIKVIYIGAKGTVEEIAVSEGSVVSMPDSFEVLNVIPYIKTRTKGD